MHNELLFPFTYTGLPNYGVADMLNSAGMYYMVAYGNREVSMSNNLYSWSTLLTCDTQPVALGVYGDRVWVGTTSGSIYSYSQASGVIRLTTALDKKCTRFFIFNNLFYLIATDTIFKYNSITGQFDFVYACESEVQDMCLFQSKAWLALASENILSFDGNVWSFVIGKNNENLASTVAAKRYGWGVTSTEQTMSIYPYRHLSGIASIAGFGSTLLCGGSNHARIMQVTIPTNTVKTVWYNDGDSVNAILPIGKNLLMSSNGKLYLGYYGNLSMDANVTAPSFVANTTLSSQNKSITIVYPNGGEIIVPGTDGAGTDVTIKWTSTHSINDIVKIQLYKSDALASVLTDNAPNTGEYVWNVTSDIVSGSDYKIEIVWLSAGDAGSNDQDQSDASFSIGTTAMTAVMPTIPSKWYFIPVGNFTSDPITVLREDVSRGHVLIGTKSGKIFSMDLLKLLADGTSIRNLHAKSIAARGTESDIATTNWMYALIDALAYIQSGTLVQKNFSPHTSIAPIQSITGTFISPQIGTNMDFGQWRKLMWTQSVNNNFVRLYLRAATTVSEMTSTPWQFVFQREGSGSFEDDLGNVVLQGCYAQIRADIVIHSDEDTALLSAGLMYTTKNSAYFFSTKFNIQHGRAADRGLLTATIDTPVNTEIKFGISNSDTGEWDNYKEISPNQFFNMDNYDTVKVGVKMIAYDTNVPSLSEFAINYGAQ